MAGIKQLLNLIARGREGKNKGISTGLSKLDSVMYGIQENYIYTIGASSGVGKSSFMIDIFIYNLIKNAEDIDINILLYSFEMSESVIFAKILSRHIYDEYGEVVTYEDILSLNHTISEHHYALVNDASEWLSKLAEKITVYDKSMSPPAIYATCKEWLKQFGEFVTVDEHKENYIDLCPGKRKYGIIDHVGLIGGAGSKKEKIDTVADYGIYFRNKCSMSWVYVQQLNRGISATDCKLNGFEQVGLQDFKDSSGTTDASEIVIALYSPYREKLATCEKYPIANVLKDRFILIEIIKNRFGKAGYNIGTTFFGEISMFRELPKPFEIGDYAPYLTLEPTKKIDTNTEIDIENDDIFKF